MKNFNKLCVNEENTSIAEPCLVCGSPTSTLHYQIIICYACAAFYRRSVKTHLSYVCQRNDGKCNVVNRSESDTVLKHVMINNGKDSMNNVFLEVGKPMCRYCRYQKCLKVGIRDYQNTEKDIKKQTKEENECIEELLDNLPEHAKPIIENYNTIFEKAFKILEEKLSSVASISTENPNYIEEFSKLLFGFLEDTKPKQTLILIKEDNIRLNFLKDFYLNSAKMLMNFPPFAKLPLQEKIILHQEFWQNFQTLERSYQACRYYGYDENDYRTPLDNYQYYDSSKSEKHFLHYADYKPYIIFFRPLIEKAMLYQRLLKKLKITEFEFTYICLLFLWNRYELPELQDSTHELGAKIISQASEDLHNYYVEELRMQSYAARQAQLFKLTHIVELFVREKRKMIAAKGIFDFSKENFPYCTFELNYYNFINNKKPF